MRRILAPARCAPFPRRRDRRELPLRPDCGGGENLAEIEQRGERRALAAREPRVENVAGDFQPEPQFLVTEELARASDKLAGVIGRHDETNLAAPFLSGVGLISVKEWLQLLRTASNRVRFAG